MHLDQARDSGALDEALKEDHRELEKVFQRVIDKFCGGDAEAIRAAWLALDEKLEAHLRTEEEMMLPSFAQFSPAAASRIVREHADIRAALQQLGIDLDLHELCKQAAENFIRMLREHAAYEERTFYAWAQTRLAGERRHAVLRRLAGMLGSVPPTTEGVTGRE